MPGVPPDAVNNVKRLLKGIFRRGKNKKQDATPQQSSSSQTANPPQSQFSTTTAAAPAIDKPLPPTHPLASEQLDTPHEAVPQNHSAQPGPKASAQHIQTADGQNASGVTPSAKEPIAATTEENRPLPPPKNDGAFDVPRPIDTSAKASNSAEQEKTAIAPAENKENVPTTSSAPLSDSALGTPNTPAKANGVAEELKPAPASVAAALDPPATNQSEEKVPVHTEAYALKSNAAAPGMSATSGPLEDFPEGMPNEKE